MCRDQCLSNVSVGVDLSGREPFLSSIISLELLPSSSTTMSALCGCSALSRIFLEKESLPRRAIFRGAYRLRLQPHCLNLTNVYWVSQNLGINQCESASRLILIVLCL